METKLKNGCFDHAPLKETLVVQDGWRKVVILDPNHRHQIMVPNMVEIPVRSQYECFYSKDTFDSKCFGCKHNQFGKEYHDVA